MVHRHRKARVHMEFVKSYFKYQADYAETILNYGTKYGRKNLFNVTTPINTFLTQLELDKASYDKWLS